MKNRTKPEVVQLELFTNRFRAIAEEMGEMLRRTAISTNVKERLDFSCALLDASGELVVNAPHMPVHLGALGLCVRSLSEVLAFEPGDVAVTNHREISLDDVAPDLRKRLERLLSEDISNR